MLLSVKLSLYTFVLLLSTFTINAQLPGQWPPLDVPPPFDDQWAKLVDQSKVPNAPISKAPGDCVVNNPFCKWGCNECVRQSDITQCPTKNDWGLTFDDGPTKYTDALLDFLASKQLKVTFFVVGSRVTQHPEILKKAVDAGHQIGVHTWSHPYLTTQTNEQIIAEIKWTELVIKQAVGVTPTYMRPPYGDIDDRVRGILSQLGYKVVIWDRDTGDWLSDSDKTFQLDWIEGNFTEWVKEDTPTGHISLEHDLYEQTAAQGPKVVPILQGAGYNIEPVAACLGDPNPYFENSNATTPTPTPSIAPSIAPSPPATNTAPAAPVTETATVKVVVVTPTSATDASNGNNLPASGETASQAISYMSNNYFLLSVVLFIVGSYFM